MYTLQLEKQIFWNCKIKYSLLDRKRQVKKMGERIGYVRVSTTEQNTARQEEMMKEWNVDRIFKEKISGKDTERKELKKLMEYVRSGDVVIVESYSRFARSTKDLLQLLEELQKKEVSFISQKEQINTTIPQGKFMLTVFAGLAEFERESILQRQKEGIAIAKAEGKMGRPKKEIKEFESILMQVNQKKITVKEVCERYGISRSKWQSMMKEYKERKENEIHKN